jgi:hypothetical protein
MKDGRVPPRILDAYGFAGAFGATASHRSRVAAFHCADEFCGPFFSVAGLLWWFRRVNALGELQVGAETPAFVSIRLADCGSARARQAGRRYASRPIHY